MERGWAAGATHSNVAGNNGFAVGECQHIVAQAAGLSGELVNALVQAAVLDACVGHGHGL